MPSDIRLEHILFEKTPAAWHPYIKLARADRPVGIWLLLLPCWWGSVLAAGGIAGISGKTLLHMLLFSLGAALMRGAGCIVNDLWDKDLDAKVERTKTRPLASGDITRRQAFIFLGALLLPAFLVLLCFNGVTVLLGLLSLPLVAVYPLMKRVTWWPQAFLGLTFNWGALMGFAAETGRLPPAAFLLYAGCVFWTLAYDTIYAHQDVEDDARIGVRSTARLFGANSRVFVTGFLGLAAILSLAAKYAAAPSVMTPLLLFPVLWRAWKLVREWDPVDAAGSLAAFRSNVTLGLLVLLMLAA